MLQSGHLVSAAGKAEATKGAALQIVFTTGRRIAITPKEITQILKDPAVVVFLLVAVFLTFYVNPHADVRQMPIGQRFAVITLASIVSIAALLLPVVLIAPVWRRLSALPMPSLLPIFISIPLTEVFSRLLLQVVWGYPSFGWSEFVEPLLPNLIMLVVFDVLFSLFVLPTTKWYRSRHSVKATQEQKPRTLTVQIANQTFPVSSLIAIEAEEHYVRLRLKGRELLLRDKFSAVVARLEQVNGLQTHRSFWVNFEHVEEFVVDRSGQMELRLTNGESVPVSRRRRKECETRVKQRHIEREIAGREQKAAVPSPL